MPRVTIRMSGDGQVEELSEYLCDYPDCPNIATEVVGHAKEIAATVVVCAEHLSARRRAKSPVPVLRPPLTRRGF